MLLFFGVLCVVCCLLFIRRCFLFVDWWLLFVGCCVLLIDGVCSFVVCCRVICNVFFFVVLSRDL